MEKSADGGWVAHCRARPRQPSFPLPVWGKDLFLTHSTDRETTAAVAAVEHA